MPLKVFVYLRNGNPRELPRCSYRFDRTNSFGSAKLFYSEDFELQSLKLLKI